MATALDRLNQAYTNWTLALVSLDQVIANPTQANIDAAVSSLGMIPGNFALNFRPTQTVDGESYDWTGMRSQLVRDLETLEKAIQRASGPFDIRSRGIT